MPTKRNKLEALVAIVGEPNVGKSTLLNKIISQRSALATDVPGTTRDRFFAPATWNGVDFTLIDTAGIMLNTQDELERNVQKQVQFALAEADLLIYVVDGKRPAESLNREILKSVRRGKKPVVLAVNKCDSPKRAQAAAGEFSFTGIKKIVPCSAISGVGTGDLLDEVAAELEKLGFGLLERDDENLSVSIIGKPNVGKSSLFNKIIGEERVVVSSMPGTTRNAIDTLIEYKDEKIKLVDTAGIKRREKLAPLPDIYAAVQSMRVIRRSDICILMIDASEKIMQQDQRLANEIVAARKGLILAVNKIDLLDAKEKKTVGQNLSGYFPFLWWAPAVPVSAKNGEGVDEILKYVLKIEENRKKEVDDQELTKFLRGKLKQNPPKRIRDERLPKIYSLRQESANPPSFVMEVNIASAISMQFRKFLENSIIKDYGFWGFPIKLRLVARKGNPNGPALNKTK